MTWREYVLARRGHGVKRSHDFEHTRVLVYNMIAINRDPKRAFPSMEKFWPLPTDADNAIDEEAHAERLHKKLQKFIKEKLHK